jgi:hypothetical protein
MGTAAADKTEEKTAEKTAEKSAIYKVLTPLERDGKRYEPGDKVRLLDHSAKPLLEVKCVEPAGKD